VTPLAGPPVMLAPMIASTSAGPFSTMNSRSESTNVSRPPTIAADSSSPVDVSVGGLLSDSVDSPPIISMRPPIMLSVDGFRREAFTTVPIRSSPPMTTERAPIDSGCGAS
jgi:hypothetical protein